MQETLDLAKELNFEIDPKNIDEETRRATLAHVVEWIFYTNLEQQKRLRMEGRRFSAAMLAAKIKNYIQHRDEHRLYEPFKEDFKGYEEPPVSKILAYSEPYLPHSGALGEMTLSVGKAVYHYYQGCDLL